MRHEMGDLSGLVDSISRHGLLEPIVVTPSNVLVAGERRLRAHVELGREFIDCVYYEETPEDVRAELEFEENFWRKNFSWQEEALGILNIYRKKKRAAALAGFSEHWHRVIAEMFGMAVGTVNYILIVAKKLEEEQSLPPDQRRYEKFGSVNEAYRLGYLAEKEDQANQKLAELAKHQTNSQHQQEFAREFVAEIEKVEADPDLLRKERERYVSNPHNTVPFEEYWADKQAKVEELRNTVYLSNTIIHGDSIAFMNDAENAGRFDHIITDPPYAIDMDNLDQENQGMANVDRVKDAHDVDENMALLERFFPAAWRCTKEKAFVIVCCDVMVWQYLYDLARNAGFAVQRWPFVWKKINQPVMNNSSGYNVTKDFEIAMVCRKPSTTLAKKQNTSFCEASNVTAVKDTGHPFSKPYELTHVLVEMASFEGQLILDPFAGGGSMILEMLRMNRKIVAIEKEDHHYNAMLENVKRLHYLKINPRFVFK